MLILILLQLSCVLGVEERLFLHESQFGHLKNYHSNAQSAAEDKYPWIARVVLSRDQYGPHKCTAICVEEAIFITAARCLVGLNIKYTTIVYQTKLRLTVKAFIMPSVRTKVLYDDIGFIIVQKDGIVKWNTIKVFNKANRTDDQFYWFDELKLAKAYKVVGYAIPKKKLKFLTVDTKYELTQLDVSVGLDLCAKILTFEKRKSGVPCYLACTYEEFKEHTSFLPTTDKGVNKCLGYHGVEGGALIDAETDELFGVATWGGYSSTYTGYIELPVGFSVPNSRSYKEDFECAKKIAADTKGGDYRKLCKDK